MKKTMKILTLMLVLATMIFTCVACSKEKEGEKLVFGTNAEFPPFEFVASEGVIGEFDGIDMAIADLIAKLEGVEAIFITDDKSIHTTY